jgi:hypothetical protein
MLRPIGVIGVLLPPLCGNDCTRGSLSFNSFQ